MITLQGFLLVWLLAYHPLAGILIFLLPMVTGLFLAVYTTYDHHTGLESESHYESSYNITSPLYNMITGNLGYHTAHHMKGSLHWSKLPEFHREIAEKIDQKYYKTYNPFRHQMIWDKEKRSFYSRTALIWTLRTSFRENFLFHQGISLYFLLWKISSLPSFLYFSSWAAHHLKYQYRLIPLSREKSSSHSETRSQQATVSLCQSPTRVSSKEDSQENRTIIES